MPPESGLLLRLPSSALGCGRNVNVEVVLGLRPPKSSRGDESKPKRAADQPQWTGGWHFFKATLASSSLTTANRLEVIIQPKSSFPTM